MTDALSQSHLVSRVQVVDGITTVLLLCAGFSWGALLFGSQQHILVLCIAPRIGDIFGGAMSIFLAHWQLASPVALLGEWVLMIMAMMLPLAIPPIAQVVSKSYRDARLPIAASVLAGYLIFWAALGVPAVVFVLAVRAISVVFETPLMISGLVAFLAIMWCWSPCRQRALNRCHAVPVFFGSTKNASAAAFAYGLTFGVRCTITCFPAMLALSAISTGLTWMFVLSHVFLSERLAHNPDSRGSAIPIALLLAAGAVLT